jgi:uncharacterized protein
MTEMTWHNEPSAWKAEGRTISLTTDAETDFWRKTHAGGIRDTGHFYHRPASGDFVAEVTLRANYETLYDQGGLMVRLDETQWLKCIVELFNPDQLYVSTVVTRNFSDWSAVPLTGVPSAVTLRIVREFDSFIVYYSLDGQAFTMVRQAYLTPAQVVEVGVTACSPLGAGGAFTAVFEDFTVK